MSIAEQLLVSFIVALRTEVNATLVDPRNNAGIAVLEASARTIAGVHHFIEALRFEHAIGMR
jgi:hypothetical protein